MSGDCLGTGGGAGNREFGKRLFISEATVKTHLALTCAKLGVETRAAAIDTAIRREGMRHAASSVS